MTTADTLTPTRINGRAPVTDLASKILNGEVFVLRRGLQELGLFEDLVELSLEGIQESMGADVAAHARSLGFDRIHTWIDPTELPRMTDYVYRSVAKRMNGVLERFVRSAFPGQGNYYFEKNPNVRFHIPYRLAASHRAAFHRFAGSRGDGKITAHGPHRDSWVDCPDNAINIWMAIGPVQHGNGLTIFAGDYRRRLAFQDGYVAPHQALHQPMTFELEPGDVILFHSDHLHGSELNVTDSTRFAVSHRITFGKPHFPYGHYHHYRHSGLAAGPLSPLALVPAKLQPSYVADRLRRLMRKVGITQATGSSQASSGDESSGAARDEAIVLHADADGSFALADFPLGTIRAISKSVCVASLGDNRFVALGRRCPHAGGDLADGWVADSRPVCPMHNLSFDPETGAAECEALAPLRTYACSSRGNRLQVDLSEAAGRSPEGT